MSKATATVSDKNLIEKLAILANYARLLCRKDNPREKKEREREKEIR